MINTVALTGRLTKDPELRYTGNGTPVLSFTLAVNRNFKNADGEREADFIMCQAWRKTAEIIANNLNKGSLIGVEGRIQTRNYQDNDGKTVYITEVVVDTVTFLESKAESQQSQANFSQAGSYKSGMSQPRTSNPGAGQKNHNTGQQNNQAGQTQNNNPFEENVDVADIHDDDLPF